ncbi:hypothetical protein BC940DRAFT_307470 [Gongronella butleri]|nr:hypothetical protein BC940DRAFT_307470 [Gongronella butleri]
MPFRCKCGRTFEKPDSFSSHTSSCAPFHQRRMSLSTSPPATPSPLDLGRRFSLRQTSATDASGMASLPSSPVLEVHQQASSPTMDYYPAFMPTALTLQNAFEGVRRRSMSYGSTFK